MRRSFLVGLVLAISPAVRADGLSAGAFAMNVTPTQFPVSVNGGFSDRRKACCSAWS